MNVVVMKKGEGRRDVWAVFIIRQVYIVINLLIYLLINGKQFQIFWKPESFHLLLISMIAYFHKILASIIGHFGWNTSIVNDPLV